jgi:hypothetical protein
VPVTVRESLMLDVRVSGPRDIKVNVTACRQFVEIRFEILCRAQQRAQHAGQRNEAIMNRSDRHGGWSLLLAMKDGQLDGTATSMSQVEDSKNTESCPIWPSLLLPKKRMDLPAWLQMRTASYLKSRIVVGEASIVACKRSLWQVRSNT